MAEMLLINPRKRRAAKKARRSPVARRRVTARRKNPIVAMKRRSNPLSAMRRRVTRRRNPINMGMGSYMTQIREALMGGAGAVVMDVVFGQVNKFLPATLKTVPGQVGAGDAVKAILTVAIGQVLSKPTMGFTKKAAAASLIVQAHGIIKSFVPATLALGYASPAYVEQGTNRIGPIRKGMNAYTATGTPLLSAYMKQGSTSLLNGARSRENVSSYR